MRYLKPFQLFEGEDMKLPPNKKWTPQEVQLVLEDPEKAPLPFIKDDHPDTITKNIVNALALLGSIEEYTEKLTPVELLNFSRYLVRIDIQNLAISMASQLTDDFPYIRRSREHMRMLLPFELRYFKNRLGEIMDAKKRAGIIDPDETLEDLESEIDVILANNQPQPEKEQEILTGRDLQNAIDTALDARDFKEVERLSKMMKESEESLFKRLLLIYE